jgi:hypothetical protein
MSECRAGFVSAANGPAILNSFRHAPNCSASATSVSKASGHNISLVLNTIQWRMRLTNFGSTAITLGI